MEDKDKNDLDFLSDLTTTEPKIKPKFDNVVASGEDKIDSIRKEEMESDDLDSEVSFKNHIKLHKEVLGLQHNELEFSTQGIVLNKIESELEKMSSASMKPKIENVVLPAPFGPSIARNSPRPTLRSTPRKAWIILFFR